MLVNLNTVGDIEEWKRDKKNVYIGRKKEGIFEQSKWANPHIITRTNRREKAVSQYLAYILSNNKLRQDLHELKGANLGCWCSPKLCHGHIILKLLNQQTVGEQQYPLSVMSHDHGTRPSTGSISSKMHNAKGTPPAKAQTPNKLSILDLSAKVDQQNTLIQQLLKESKENKETITRLQTEAEENKITIASLHASIDHNTTEDAGECKAFIEALQTRTIELEAEKINMAAIIGHCYF